jgi:hypothetical protein
MKFISKTGIRIDYSFTVGDVISIKSWIYRGERHHEIWFRTTDGREWCRRGLPLGINLTRGQRIAFAWCAVENQENEQLVAVRNCSTGQYNVVSHCMAIELGVHRYGRRAFRWLGLFAAVFSGLDWLAGPSSWIPHVPFAMIAAGVLGGALLGFLFSCSSDPDPERVIDKNVLIALAGIEQAWVMTRLASNHRGGRMRSVA